jgi:hypothetical protein
LVNSQRCVLRHKAPLMIDILQKYTHSQEGLE